jgi:hypothetical protein
VTATAKQCPTGGVVFQSGLDRDQDGVLGDDEVELSEPSCGDVVNHDVTVASNADAAALADVRVITGKLSVILTTATLPRLESLGGALLASQAALAMPALTQIAGDVHLEHVTAAGFPVLTRVHSLTVLRSQLADLSGFPALRQIDGDVEITGSALQTLDVMLSAPTGNLVVQDNSQLTRVSWQVAGEVGDVTIANNAALTAVDVALSAQDGSPTAAHTVQIQADPQLTHIGLTADRVWSIAINSVPQLTDVAMTLSRVDSTLEIFPADLSSSTQPAAFQVSLASHGTSIALPAFDIDGPLIRLHSAVPIVADQVALSGSLLPSLDQDAQLVRVQDLILTSNPLLDHIAPLEVDGELNVTANSVLTSIDFLTNTDLTSVFIAGNPQLVSMPSLATVHQIDGELGITNNPQLTTVQLPELVQANGELHVVGNAALQHLELPALISVSSAFIASNAELPSCAVTALFTRLSENSGTLTQSDNDDSATCGP